MNIIRKEMPVNLRKRKVNPKDMAVNLVVLKVNLEVLRVNPSDFKVNFEDLKVNYDDMTVGEPDLKVNYDDMSGVEPVLPLNPEEIRLIGVKMKENLIFLKPQATDRGMPTIELKTEIQGDIETCFDLARSIDFHQISTAKTNEKAISGRTSGLIDLDENVTWQATHFGIRQKLTSKITVFKRPSHFRDEQLKGVFKFIVHDHYFEQGDGKVMMRDVFSFQSPLGIVGQLFEKLVLTKYLTKFLVERNNLIKEYAETTKWKSVLNDR
jgi:ligand-binding SRPBCC domain-containing protein